MVRKRNLLPERKKFIKSLLEHCKLNEAREVQDCCVKLKL